MPELDLDAEITRLLTPHDTLAPWIFDPSGIMKEDVREGLMNIARKIVSETIYGIPGLEVKDVCLTGSSSGYLYKDDSDIDIRIEVHNINCATLATCQKDFNDFLANQKTGVFAHGYSTRLHGKFVDVKMSANEIDFISLYSIKNNKWLIKPTRDFAKGLSFESVKKYYLKRKNDAINELKKIRAENKGKELGRKMEEMYVNLLHSFYETKSVEDFLAYKLFCYENFLKPIKNESVLADNDALKDASMPCG